MPVNSRNEGPAPLPGAGIATSSGPASEAPILDKILVGCSEDWFALSHFKPLLRRLRKLAREVVVVARSSGREGEIEALGCRTIDFDYNRSSMNPLQEAQTVRRLAQLIASERPEAVHLIAMKPIVLGGLATAWTRPKHTIVHMTGLGFLSVSTSAKSRAARYAALRVVQSTVRRKGSWLLIENEADLAYMQNAGVQAQGNVTLLGGAGIDPDVFSPPEALSNPVPTAAYVARMIRSKGVDVLMEAADHLKQRGVPLRIELHGATDDGNPEAVPAATLANWANGDDRHYMGFARDVASIWQRSDIFVLPTRGGEGMPRALLEAASCARAVVVTDVPGCRHFVRDGVEGLLVPPGDAVALADALERLARDPELRSRLGANARARVLGGFTEAHVEDSIEQAYRAMLATSEPARSRG